MTGDKFIPELHLKPPGFTYSACGLLTKHLERIQKFGEAGNLIHLYRNELDKPCFAHDAAYYDGKDLAKITISDKILKDSAYEIDRNRNYDGYQKELASVAHKFFDKKAGSGAIATSKVGIRVNEQLAEELHKPVTKTSKQR